MSAETPVNPRDPEFTLPDEALLRSLAEMVSTLIEDCVVGLPQGGSFIGQEWESAEDAPLPSALSKLPAEYRDMIQDAVRASLAEAAGAMIFTLLCNFDGSGVFQHGDDVRLVSSDGRPYCGHLHSYWHEYIMTELGVKGGDD